MVNQSGKTKESWEKSAVLTYRFSIKQSIHNPSNWNNNHQLHLSVQEPFMRKPTHVSCRYVDFNRRVVKQVFVVMTRILRSWEVSGGLKVILYKWWENASKDDRAQWEQSFASFPDRRQAHPPPSSPEAMIERQFKSLPTHHPLLSTSRRRSLRPLLTSGGGDRRIKRRYETVKGHKCGISRSTTRTK